MWPYFSQAFSSVSAQIPFNRQVCSDFQYDWTSVLTSCFLLTTAILLILNQIHSFNKITVYQLCITIVLRFEGIWKVYRDQSATDRSLKEIYNGTRGLGPIQRIPIQGTRRYVPYKKAGKVLRVLCRERSLPGVWASCSVPLSWKPTLPYSVCWCWGWDSANYISAFPAALLGSINSGCLRKTASLEKEKGILSPVCFLFLWAST